MSNIVRPNKVGGSPNWAPGDDLLADDFNNEGNTIYDDYNGNITDFNCAANMGLLGSKLADAPLGISTSKINDKAVTASKIANDSSVDANRAIGNDHVKNSSLSLAKLKNINYELVPFSWSLPSRIVISLSPSRIVVGANYAISILFANLSTGYSGLVYTPATFTPVLTLPTATKQIIGLYLDTVNYTTLAAGDGKIMVISADLT